MSWREGLRPELTDVAPYRASEAPADIFLDANESPIVWPEPVQRELAAQLAKLELGRYPDVMAHRLREQVAGDLGVRGDQIVFGNGSDELITLLAAAFGRPPRHQNRVRVLYPSPTFVMYRLGVLGTGATALEVPLRPDFTLDEAAVERAILAGQPNILFFARPNNPTGTLWPRESMVKLARLHPRLIVVIDEAYAMYAEESCLDLVGKHENVVLLRTLSKVGLAALRIGMLIGTAALVAEIEKVRGPYNLGSLNQEAARWLLERHKPLIEEAIGQVIKERDVLATELGALGFTVFPSKANFVLVRHAQSQQLYQGLLDRRIRVKNLHRPGPLENCLRITVGSAEHNRQLLDALRGLARP